MEKLINYLEKYVQWVALAIAGGFLLWVVWAFIITAPASKAIGTTELRPGEIDSYILKNSADQLTNKINNAVPPVLVVEPFEPQFRDAMVFAHVETVVLGDYMFDYRSIPFDPNAPQPFSSSPGLAKINVIALPDLPPITINTTEFGRTTVLKDVPAAGAAAAMVPNPIAPGHDKSDIDWTTNFGTIPFIPLADQWNKSFGIDPATKLPRLDPKWNLTAILELELVRQEQLPGGQWGPSVVIKRLVNQSLFDMPQPNAPRGAINNYFTWAAQKAADMVAPPFYVQAQGTEQPSLPLGDPWQSEDGWIKSQNTPPPPAVVPVAPPSNTGVHPRPNNVPQGPPPNHPMPGNNPVHPPSGYHSPFDPERPIGSSADRSTTPVMVADSLPGDGRPPGQRPPNPSPNPNLIPGGFYPNGQPNMIPQPIAPAMAVAGAGVPTAAFNPGLLTQDIPVWRHDDTAMPGKTYRYMMRYKLWNPLFGRNATAAANAAWVKQIYLQSPDGEWSKPVTIPAKTVFFCAGNATPDNGMSFDVFTWADGKWRMHKFDVKPGDAIGQMYNNVDFYTGVTLVEARQDTKGDHTVVVMATDDGSTIRRDAQKDQNDPEYSKKKAQSVPALPPAAPPVPTAGAGFAPLVSQ